jgi:uncharacterized membrane protein
MAKKSNANIIALGFNSLDGAENMLENVHLWQEKQYFTVKDAVVVTKGSGDNQLQIKQTVKKTGKWALGGGGIGLLAGLLLGGPVGGLVVGATIGAISGALKDSGIDDNFIHVIGTSLRADTSALLVMVEPNPNRNDEEFARELGEQRAMVLSTTLPPEREQQLRRLLSGAASAAAVAPAIQPPLDATVATTEDIAEASTEDGMQAPIEADTAIDAEPIAETATDVVPEASTEAGMEAAPEAINDTAPAAVSETMPETVAEGAPDVATEAIPDLTVEANTDDDARIRG